MGLNSTVEAADRRLRFGNKWGRSGDTIFPDTPTSQSPETLGEMNYVGVHIESPIKDQQKFIEQYLNDMMKDYDKFMKSIKDKEKDVSVMP